MCPKSSLFFHAYCCCGNFRPRGLQGKIHVWLIYNSLCSLEFTTLLVFPFINTFHCPEVTNTIPTPNYIQCSASAPSIFRVELTHTLTVILWWNQQLPWVTTSSFSGSSFLATLPALWWGRHHVRYVEKCWWECGIFPTSSAFISG